MTDTESDTRSDAEVWPNPIRLIVVSLVSSTLFAATTLVVVNDPIAEWSWTCSRR